MNQYKQKFKLMITEFDILYDLMSHLLITEERFNFCLIKINLESLIKCKNSQHLI